MKQSLFDRSKKTEAKAEMDIDIQSLFNALSENANSAYDHSIILLSSAMLGDITSYAAARINLWKKLNSSPNNSFKAWMLGRMVVAGKIIGESKDVEQALKHLRRFLNKCKKDEMSGWAWGYLASVNHEEYKNAKETMLAAVNDAPTRVDKLWVHVMNMEAAALVKDKDTYDEISKAMQALTGTSSLAEAISLIPENDWQAWCFAKVRKAAMILEEDVDVCAALEKPTQNAIKKALVLAQQQITPELTAENIKNIFAMKACVMMAELTNREANQLMSEEIFQRSLISTC